MKKYFSILLLLNLSYSYAICQSKKQLYEVSIIKMNGDTIKGKMRAINPEATFSTYEKFWINNKKVKYHPSDIRSFSSQGFRFESVKLKRIPNITFKDVVFVKRIIDGLMILYIIEDNKVAIGLNNLKTKCVVYYYIRKQSDNSALLAYKEKCPTDLISVISQPSNYKEFCNYFSDNPSVKKKIENKEFRRKDIYDIVNEYNRMAK